jgi:hypothetical protein
VRAGRPVHANVAIRMSVSGMRDPSRDAPHYEKTATRPVASS